MADRARSATLIGAPRAALALGLSLALGLALFGCSERRELSGPCESCEARVHPPGILDEDSPEFHGAELARRDWDFALCASCHGADFRGGLSGGDCTSCHGEGPTACVTCHGDSGPTTGAHGSHLAAQLACAECHTVPASWDAPGHILGDTAPAEVTFGARAQLTPVPAERLGPPVYADGTCSNVYCHGATLGAGGALTMPRWDQPIAPACGSCHGVPPPSHAQASCATCHPADAPHIDGITQVGRTEGCDGCHGSAASPAPPVDLAGNTYTTALGVGAHQAHLRALSGLRGPIACATCHLVPATVDAVGHLDSLAPAEVTASLGWDRTAGSCATAWCHGPARPVWTEVGVAGAACGTCHGIPPATGIHTPGMALTDCVTCHPQSVEPSGAIRIIGGTSQHMDGTIDAL